MMTTYIAKSVDEAALLNTRRLPAAQGSPGFPGKPAGGPAADHLVRPTVSQTDEIRRMEWQA